MGLRLGLKLQRAVETGRHLGQKPWWPQRQMTLGPCWLSEPQDLSSKGQYPWSSQPLPALPRLGAQI